MPSHGGYSQERLAKHPERERKVRTYPRTLHARPTRPTLVQEPIAAALIFIDHFADGCSP
jgi:hypothetical protein